MKKDSKKGRKRIYTFELKLNEIENSKLNCDSLSAGISKSELIRNLIIKNEVKARPDNRFYEVMNNMSKIYLKLNELTKISKENNWNDKDKYKDEVKKWNEFMNKVNEKFLT